MGEIRVGLCQHIGKEVDGIKPTLAHTDSQRCDACLAEAKAKRRSSQSPLSGCDRNTYG
ncbi:MAG: hypothetical protein UDG94_01595 [Peptococcaceae bacterium]|nr:hypothetical protein [Peptococcaceae bacterium]